MGSTIQATLRFKTDVSDITKELEKIKKQTDNYEINIDKKNSLKNKIEEIEKIKRQLDKLSEKDDWTQKDLDNAKQLSNKMKGLIDSVKDFHKELSVEGSKILPKELTQKFKSVDSVIRKSTKDTSKWTSQLKQSNQKLIEITEQEKQLSKTQILSSTQLQERSKARSIVTKFGNGHISDIEKYKNAQDTLQQFEGWMSETEFNKAQAQLNKQKDKQLTIQATLSVDIEKSKQKIRSELQKLKDEGIFEGEITDNVIDDIANGASVADYSKQMRQVASQNQQIAGSFENMSIAADDATKSFATMDKEMDRVAEWQKKVDEFASMFTHFFTISGAVETFRSFVITAVNTIKDLDAAMTETAVVTDYTVSDMWSQLQKYTDVANEMGATIKGAYETMTLYYQQGLNTQQAFAMGTETMKMARIAGMDYAATTDAMTAAVRGFNMALNETSATRINDVYSKLAAITASDTKEISNAMSRTASIAANVGLDFETTSAYLAEMIETTRESAENLGTALKTISARYAGVTKPASELTEEMKDALEGESVDVNTITTALSSAGVTALDASGQFRPLADVLLELNEKWDTLDLMTQRYVATQFAGSRQQSRFIAMMQNYSRTQELVTAANNSAGASEEQFEKTLESLESKLNQLSNAWSNFTMGITNSDVVKNVVDIGTTLLTMLNEITDKFGALGSMISRSLLLVGGFKLGKGAFEGFIQYMRDIGKEGAIGLGESLKQNIPKNFPHIGDLIQDIKNSQIFTDTVNFEPIIEKEALNKQLDEYKELLKNRDVLQHKRENWDGLNIDSDAVDKLIKDFTKVDNQISNIERSFGELEIGSIEDWDNISSILNEENWNFSNFENFLQNDTTFLSKIQELEDSTLDNKQKKVKIGQAITSAQNSYITSLYTSNQLENQSLIGKLQNLVLSQEGFGYQAAKNNFIAAEIDLEVAKQTLLNKENILKKLGWDLDTIELETLNEQSAVKSAQLKVEKQKIALQAKARTAWMLTSLSIAAVVAAVAALAYAIYKVQQLTPEGVLKKFSSAAETAAETASTAAENVDTLTESISNLKEGIEDLNNMSIGSTSWSEELASVLNILQEIKEIYPDIYKYVEWDASGMPSISDTNLALIKSEVSKQSARSAAVSSALSAAETIQSNYTDKQKYGITYVDEQSGIVSYAESTQREDYRNDTEYYKAKTEKAELDASTKQAEAQFKSAVVALSIEKGASQELAEGLAGTIDADTITNEITKNVSEITGDIDKQYQDLFGGEIEDIKEKSDADKKLAIATYEVTDKYSDLLSTMDDFIDNLSSNASQFFTKILNQDINAFTKTETNQLEALYDNINDTIKDYKEQYQDDLSTGVTTANTFEDYLVQQDINLYSNIVRDNENLKNAISEDDWNQMMTMAHNEGLSITQYLQNIISPLDSMVYAINHTGEDIMTNPITQDERDLYQYQMRLGDYREEKEQTEKEIWQIAYETLSYADVISGRADKDIFDKSLLVTLNEDFAKEFMRYYSGDKYEDELIDKLNNVTSFDQLNRLTTESKTIGDFLDEEQTKYASSNLDILKTSLRQNGVTEELLDKEDILKSYENLSDKTKSVIDKEVLPKLINNSQDLITTWAEEGILATVKKIFNAKEGSSIDQKTITQKLYDQNITWTEEDETSLSTYQSNQYDKLTSEEGAELSTTQITAYVENFKNGHQEIRTELGKTIKKESDQNKILQQMAYRELQVHSATKKLNEQLDEYSDILKEGNRNSLNWLEAVEAIQPALSEAFGFEVDEDFIFNNRDDIVAWANGSVDAFNRVRKAAATLQIQDLFGGEEGLEKALDNVSEQAIDFKDIMNQIDGMKAGTTIDVNNKPAIKALYTVLQQAGKTAEEIATIFAGLNLSINTSTKKISKGDMTDEEWQNRIQKSVDKGTLDASDVQDALDSGEYTVTRIKASKIDTSDLDLNNDIDDTGSSSDNDDDNEKWENPYDRYEKTLRKIERLQRKVNNLQEEFDELLEGANVSGQQLLQNYSKQSQVIAQENASRRQIIKGRRKQIKQYTSSKKVSEYLNKYNIDVDKNGNITDIGYSQLQKLAKKKNGSEEGEVIETIISKLDNWNDSINEQTDAIEDNNKTLKDLKNDIRDQAMEFENTVKEAIIDERQKEIDKLSDIDESINDANQALIESIQSQLELDRQKRDNEKTERDLSDKRQRLAYLQQDTSGANALEIKSLQEELADAEESYSDSLIDQALDKLEDKYDEASKQREKQISIMEEQLETDQENGAINKEVTKVILEGLNKKGIIKSNSKLEQLLNANNASLSDKELEDQNNENSVNAGSYYTNNIIDEVKKYQNQYKGESAELKKNRAINKSKAGQAISFFDENGTKYLGAVLPNGKVISGTKVYDVKLGDDGLWYMIGETKGNTPEGKLASLTKSVTSDSKADRIKTLQEGMEDVGYYDGKKNGKWNKKLQNALKQFQGILGIKKSGVWDHNTINAFKKSRYKKYKTGGIADYTGPAWLDGTPSKPELILNAQDTENFIQLKNILSGLMSGSNTAGTTNTVGDMNYEISINVDSLSSDYDVEQVADKVKRMITQDSNYRNVNTLSRVR